MVPIQWERACAGPDGGPSEAPEGPLDPPQQETVRGEQAETRRERQTPPI